MSQRTSRLLTAAICVCLLLPAAARFVALDGDPPIISWSVASWGDPGHYLYNARTRVLFGEWRPDEGSSLFVTPGYALLAAAWFSLIGAGYFQGALLATLSGFVVIIAAALFADSDRAHTPGLRGWIPAAASLTASYVVFALQGVPKGDMESVAICAITAVFLARIASTPEHRLKATAFSAGLGIGLAPFVKNYSILFSFAAIVAWIASCRLPGPEWPSRWKKASPLLAAGLAVSSLVWIGWFLWIISIDGLPQLKHECLHLAGLVFPSLAPPHPEALPRGGGGVSLLRFFESNLFIRQPAETILAALGISRLVIRRDGDWPGFFAAVWLGTGIAVMSIMGYAPLRYRFLFFVPALFFACSALRELLRDDVGPESGKQFSLAAALLGIVAAPEVWRRSAGLASSRTLTLSAFAIGVLLLVLIFAWVARRRIRLRLLAGAVILIWIVSSLVQWRVGGPRSGFHMKNMAAHVAERYPGAVLGGLWGIQLALWTDLDAHAYTWMPTARKEITILIDEPDALALSNFRWSELERRSFPPIGKTLVVAEVIR